MPDPFYYVGDPHWDHDDECAWDNLCMECLKKQDALWDEEFEIAFQPDYPDLLMEEN